MKYLRIMMTSRSRQLVKLLKRLIKQEHLYSDKQLKEMKSQLKVVENELVELEKLTSKGFGKK
jgi:hypothetical protein